VQINTDTNEYANILNTLSSIPNWPFNIIAAFIGIGGTFCLYKWRDHVARCAKFHEAFTDVLAGLRKYTATEVLVRSSIAKHDCAIEDFRRGLNRKNGFAFNHDCDDYRKCRQRFLDYTGRVGTSADNQSANDLRRSIDHLLTYTEKHWFYPLVLWYRKERKDFRDNHSS